MVDKYEIGPDENLVTPERMAKGDLEVVINIRGKISRAIPANLTIVKELVRRNVFPYHYEIYGVGFLELRSAFRAPWGPRSSAVLLEQWGIGVSTSKADSIYQNVCRQMGAERINVIEWVMEQFRQAENEDHHDAYRESFEKLTQVMDEERERLLQSIV